MGVNIPVEASVNKYVSVTASSLNVRKGAGTNYAKVTDREPALFGSVLRVFKEKDGWYKISSSAEHWVSKQYTQEVKRALVTATNLNVRSGSGIEFPKVDSLLKDTEVFVYSEKDKWSKISVEEKWVSSSYLKI